MRQLIVCFCLIFWVSITGHAQDTTLQRLMAMRDDTVKVSKLAMYAKSLIRKDDEKAKRIYRDVIQLAEKLNAPEWIGFGLMDIGVIEATQAKDKVGIAYFRKAIPYFKKAKQDNKVAACLLNIGICSEKTGDVDTRIKVTLEAIDILEKTPSKLSLCHAYNCMGVMFYNLENYPKGEEYFKKALPVATELKDTTKLIMALYGLSSCLSSTGKIPEALQYASQAMAIAKASKQDYHLCLANECLAEIMVKAKNGRQAIPYAQEALKYAVASNDAHYELISTITLTDSYGLTNQQAERIKYLKHAQKLAEANGVVMQLHNIYKGLSEAYSKQNNYKEAFNYYGKFVFYRDSMMGEKNKKNVAELEAKYQSSLKEKQLSQQQLKIVQKEVELRRSREMNGYSIGAAFMALLGAGMVFLHYRNKRRLHQQHLQTIQREKELQLLQAAMEGEEKERSRIAKDLHDGVAGMLAAAKMQLSSLSIKNSVLSETKEFTQAVKLLDDSCHEVRMTSHNLMPEILLQHGLDEAVRRFCNNISNDQVLQIQYASYGNIGRFVISFELTVYRVVQELLNNIVKHSQATVASVQLSVQDDFLSISIEDNGVGFDKNRSHQSGTGLNSLKRRLQAMNGTLEIDAQQEQGVTAFIGIDITNYIL